MSYFSLDDILTTSTQLPTQFTLPTPLNIPQAIIAHPSESLPLPLWLIEHLAPEVLNPSANEESELEPVLTVTIPEWLSRKALRFYKASANNAVLQGHFYDFVRVWCNVMDDEEVREIVMGMLVERVGSIWDGKVDGGLDEWEKDLWKICRKSKTNN
ncbi:hypothetical protein DAMA08_022880 [Martiniozyma asiatica (nom. inval.)]|nr:hypothetical protein DAMA08_022880 [Martiniozyma asiatica]